MKDLRESCSAKASHSVRQQAKVSLEEATIRNREPIQRTRDYQESAAKMDILPEIGDMTLSQEDNMAVKPLVTKLVRGKLSPARG
jgi:hypothetical protein